jgi:hypothetical protein
LLLDVDVADCLEARERAKDALTRISSLLDKGLYTLILGRAYLALAMKSVASKEPTTCSRDYAHTSGAQLDKAADGLRAAGQNGDTPRGLLARAAFRRSVGEWDSVASDLDEIEEIAEPGPMRLYLCDMALERTRLAFARIEAFAPLNGMLEKDNPAKPIVPSRDEIAQLKGEAEKQLEIAAEYIDKCGYHRRDEELAELQAVLKGEKTFASLPPRV